MKNSSERTKSPNYSDSQTRISGSVSFETEPIRSSPWSSFFISPTSYNGWFALKRAMYGVTMRRIFGLNKTNLAFSSSDIWLLGTCYKIAQDDPTQCEGYASFVEDFSSRILITYRKGFDAIGDSKYTSDAGWGCMVRSSQMLIAQALIVHQLGRSWRKPLDKPLEKKYFEILNLFGDSENSPFSIHNLLKAGKAYDLAPGSWVGPYAMCCTWDALLHSGNVGPASEICLYIVSGDENGERGGAPVVCIEDISRKNKNWTPLLLLVPLVLGCDKINPRYLPLLGSTFTFPQSLGILGGRPGVSTYIIGVQDDTAFYLDPHEVNQVVNVTKENLEVDTSSYHCNVVRQMPLDSIDPSLAIGFYCRDKNDFDDFCLRVSELVGQSNGAPLFTLIETSQRGPSGVQNEIQGGESEGCTQEEDWQIL